MIYKYKVNWYFEEGEKELVDEGLLVARSFTEAMENILQGFDDSELLTVNLEYIDDGNLIRFETIAYVFKDCVDNGTEIASAITDLIATQKEASL